MFVVQKKLVVLVWGLSPSSGVYDLHNASATVRVDRDRCCVDGRDGEPERTCEAVAGHFEGP